MLALPWVRTTGFRDRLYRAEVMTKITYRDDRDLPLDPLVTLYRANAWSSAEKGDTLREAMRGSHSVVTAWAEDRLVGLGNTLSDGHLVVYYPHLLVHPDFRRRGIGAEILRRLRRRYDALHMHILVAEGRAVEFFEKCGFARAGETQAMWIYNGGEH
jgi:GNAT superfamily N-acetyltransferase